MKKNIANLILILLTLTLLSIGVFSQTSAITFQGKLTDATTAQPTAFTYQGKLTDGGSPANGTYDFQFTLYDEANMNMGTATGSLTVTNGIFTAGIDGASALFTSSNPPRFLEISVRLSGGGSYTTLAPRQPFTSSPYAIKSLSAASSESLSVTCVTCVADSQISSVSAGKITGVLGASQGGTGSGTQNFVDLTSNQIIGGSKTISGTFSGNGAGLSNLSGAGITNLNASNISSGTLNNLRLGVVPIANGGTGSVAQNFVDLTTTQTIAGNKTFSDALSGNTVNSATQFNLGGNRVLFADGNGNLFAGMSAGQISTGVGNSFFGRNAGIANTTGVANSIFGSQAGQSNTLGNDNSFFGLLAGSSNTTGSRNTTIGYDANVGAGDLFNATALGANAVVSQSNSLVLGSNSDVGIGTSAPARKLHLSGAGSDGAGQTDLRITGTGPIAAGITLESTGLSGRTYSFLSTADNTGGGGGGPGRLAVFDVTAGEYRMVIDASGNLGLGEQSPADKLDVNGIIRVALLGAAGGTSLCRNFSNQISDCSSSARYKSNINPFSSGLSLIKQLRPVSFAWKDGGMLDMGLVAEEVAAVEPLLTTTNAKGEVEGVKYDRVGVVLVNAVNEQQMQIEAQQKQIEQQKKQIESLTKIVCAMNSNADICRQ